VKPTPAIDQRVLALREAFDRTFAQPRASHRAAPHHVLLVQVDDAPYALRATDAIALARDRKIVPVPSGMPALLGLCGFRGDALPVFSLARLLGHAQKHARWIAVCARGAEHVGLAFDVLDGYLALESDALHPLEPRPHPHIAASVRTDTTTRALIDVPAITDHIDLQRTELARSKEQ
jgi:chemotaxis signal transduction protein